MDVFATQLNKLFESAHHPERRPHTNGEVAAAVTAAGHPISKPYLVQLRSGEQTDPSTEMVVALAKFFKVKPDYFFDDRYAAKVDSDLKLLAQLHGVGLRRLRGRFDF